MSNLAVLASCTERRGMMAQLEAQLQDAKIPFIVDFCPPYPTSVRTLEPHIRAIQRLLARAKKFSHVVLVDAWDVLFFGTEQEVIGKIPKSGVVFSAERNCWPDSYLAPHFTAPTPWKYLNSGFVAGARESFEDWLDRVTAHPAFHRGIVDQQWFSHRALDTPALCPLDTRTDLCYSMYLEAGELQINDGRPINTVTGTRPNFIHFNGKTDPTNFQLLMAIDRGIKVSVRNVA